jgi:hypothetical protein
MTKFISFLAVVAFALSISSVEAAKKKTPVAAASTSPQNGPVASSTKKGSEIRAGCKMSGGC